MKRTVIAAALALLPLTSQAREYKTVTWFADHPTEMHNVMKLCRDNAGLAAHNPNCINAEEAGTIVLQRELDAKAWPNGHATVFDPEYYRHDPAERRRRLSLCDALAHRPYDGRYKMQPGDINDQMCQAARAAQ